MKSSKTPLIIALLAIGLLAASCGQGGGNEAAADVDGHEISYDDLLVEMADRGEVYLEDPETYLDLAPFEPYADGDIDVVDDDDMSLLQGVLTRQIIFYFFESEVEVRDGVVTEEDATNARAQVESSWGEILDTPFHNREVERFEDVMVLTRLLGEDLGEVTVEELYEQIIAGGDTACTSHILVATAAEADTVIADLAAGGSFEETAIELSLDPGSGAEGGDLGCGPASQFVPEFGAAVLSQPVGEVGEPVETQFGFHIIRVNARPMPLDDDTRLQLEAQIPNAAEQATAVARDEWIVETLESSEVTVDPKLGYWDAEVGAVVSEDPNSVDDSDPVEE